jgi:hypothetical protein
MPEDKFFMRKETLVMKDFDTAFSCYDKLVGKVMSIREWTVTVMIALIVFNLTYADMELINTLITVAICMGAFLILELRERSSMKFDKAIILEMEQIFMNQDNNDYELKIKEFVFRDIRLCKLGRKAKIMHLIQSCKKPEVIVWYSTWVLIWVVIVLIKHHQPTIIPSV